MNSDIPVDLQSAIAERYELRRVLGRGGMATVYLAHDRKHQREVALKVLRPDLAATLGAERFLKEIQIAARLTHPHILAMHDSGESGGFLYYVMPYIDGPSLRLRLEQAKYLSVEQTLAIAAPVADALSYAHRVGVFHRDIKPENILFSQNHAIVADFGIAKAVSTAGGANLTRTGFPLGTPGYMSPEQAAGMTDLDGRTDVYSLSVVIYEMLVGEIAGRWPTEDAVRAGRFLDAPAAHKARLAAAGTRIEAALVRGMSVRHDQRTETPVDLMNELLGIKAAPRRKYRDGEVRDIVNRAAELEATNPTESGAMTIGGVEALAAEVGIAPDVVRAAADSIRVSRSTPGPAVEPIPQSRLIGGPTRISFERVVDGELPESEYPALVDEIRYVLKNGGQVSQLGRSFTWATARGPGGTTRRDIEIAVTVRGGRTRITLHEGLAPLQAAVFGGIGGGMGGGGMGPIIAVSVGALHLVPAAIAVIVPMWLVTTAITARTVYSKTSRKRLREMEQLADTLAQYTRELIEDHQPSLTPSERQRRIGRSTEA